MVHGGDIDGAYMVTTHIKEEGFWLRTVELLSSRPLMLFVMMMIMMVVITMALRYGPSIFQAKVIDSISVSIFVFILVDIVDCGIFHFHWKVKVTPVLSLLLFLIYLSVLDKDLCRKRSCNKCVKITSSL